MTLTFIHKVRDRLVVEYAVNVTIKLFIVSVRGKFCRKSREKRVFRLSIIELEKRR